MPLKSEVNLLNTYKGVNCPHLMSTKTSKLLDEQDSYHYNAHL